MNTIHFLYFPTFHEELLSKGISAKCTFMPCGIDSDSPTTKLDTPLNKSLTRELPFQGKPAQKILDEMLSLGSILGRESLFYPKSNALLSPLSALNEEKALLAFAKTGAHDGSTSAFDVPWHNKKIACQKVLLLAYSLEKQYLEIDNLAYDIIAISSRLDESFMDPISSTSISAYMRNDFDRYRAQSTVALGKVWKQVLEAMLIFVPIGTYFFTMCEETLSYLLEKKLLKPIHSIGNNAATDALAAAPSLTGFCSGTAWEILGYSSLQKAPAWLDRSITIVTSLSLPNLQGARLAL